jgi:ABC-type nitrate/sulfonate/bicarbonate transport system substrate-binding protein
LARLALPAGYVRFVIDGGEMNNGSHTANRREDGSLTRRAFWLRSMRAAGAVGLTGTVSGVLAACGSDNSSAQGGGDSNEVGSPRIAASTSVIPIFVQQAAGPLLYGAPFGLKIPEKNYKVLQSHSVAIQTVLAHDADIVAGSVFGSMAGASQGIPLRLFSTARTRDDDVLAVRGKVQGFADILNDGVRVSTDSKGGTAYAELQGMLNANGKAGTTVGELPGLTVLESSGQRQAALAAGQVDAAIMHIDQFWQVQRVRKDTKYVARSVDLPVFPLTGYAALRPWLDKNQATATAIVKSIAACTEAFAADFNEYRTAVKHLIESPPPEKDLRRLWQVAVDAKIWPVDGTITPETYGRAATLAVQCEVFVKAPKFADAVDDRPSKAARS